MNCEQNTANFQISGFKEFNEFFDGFDAEIFNMHTTEKNIDTIYRVSEQLFSNFGVLLKNMMPNHLKSECSTVLDTATKHIIEKLQSRNTAKKRLKLVKADECYVQPSDSAIGLKWKAKIECGNDLMDHKPVQTSYKYISIKETLESEFKNNHFYDSYFDYNENRKCCF